MPAAPVRMSPLMWAIAAGIALVGFAHGARSISDNSMFTHLRTGIDMAKSGAIPRHDTYSFTAHGHAWVVQSWFPEWTYGWAHRIGGYQTVVLEQALLMAGVALLIFFLARAHTPLRTLVAAGVAVAFGAPWWGPRPLLFGLICLGLTILVVERRWNPWWLVPIVWLWVNSHGSFPLGVAWLVARGAGEALDSRGWPRVSLLYLRAFAVGLVVSIVNPLGYKLLGFPATALQKASIFRHIREWNATNFQTTLGMITLIALLGIMVILFRRGAVWADVLPVAAFLVLGLVAERNLAVAGVIVAPALGHALWPRVGERELMQIDTSTIATAVAIVIALQYLLWGVGIYRRGALDLAHYPRVAVGYLQDNDLLTPQHRMAEPDAVGNYLDAKFGSDARVFIDDRYDMFPNRVSNDYFSLLRADRNSFDILNHYKVDTVLWNERLPLAAALEASPQWNLAFKADGWEVFRRS